MADSAQFQPRRGSFIVRLMTRPAAPLQHPAALRAAGRMVLALPVVQTALLVGVLKAELWQALLGAEGLVIAWLAMGQFRRATVEGKLAGFGISLLNTAAMGVAGLALGGHVLWVTGAAGMVAVMWLTFATTRGRTVRRAWVAFALLLLPVALFCGATRAALEASASRADPASRANLLAVTWVGYHWRGGNGTERALLRLRQAQAAFETGDYDAAFEFAHDGAFDEHARSRVPATLIGGDVLDSLLRLKAQALYNRAWDKDDRIRTTINVEPLPAETLDEGTVRVRWGW